MCHDSFLRFCWAKNFIKLSKNFYRRNYPSLLNKDKSFTYIFWIRDFVTLLSILSHTYIYTYAWKWLQNTLTRELFPCLHFFCFHRFLPFSFFGWMASSRPKMRKRCENKKLKKKVGINLYYDMRVTYSPEIICFFSSTFSIRAWN